MSSSIVCATGSVVEVESPAVKYTPTTIESTYSYDRTEVSITPGRVTCTPHTETLKFVTDRVVPKLGVMLVGWGGNNGTTVTAGILANKLGISWRTKKGMRAADYVGSVTQSSTVRLGSSGGTDVYVPFNALLPMVSPSDFVLGGWDISSMNLADAMVRAEVLEVSLQEQLLSHMAPLKPLPSIYFPEFIAANQSDRADNVLTGSKQEQMDVIRANIRDFKASSGVDKVIVLWSANTERFSDILAGINDTADNLLASIAAGHSEISPSTLFAVATMLEGCSYINGSPQNTFVPGAVELAQRCNVYIGGDDFKSGQTKMKSVLVDYLVSAGIKPVSIASYNHLGNNDGKNLSAPHTFRSKEISKSNVVDDMVASNGLLFKEGEHPDHTVVIKYMPFVGDSKRALDEYVSEIFLGGLNTIAMHNTCEDSLLAAPLILDLVIITELCERITVQRVGVDEAPVRFHAVLSLLSYLCKAPLFPAGAPVINALFKQREALVNVFRACVGLAPENHMMMEHRLPAPIAAAATFASSPLAVAAASSEDETESVAVSPSPVAAKSKAVVSAAELAAAPL